MTVVQDWNVIFITVAILATLALHVWKGAPDKCVHTATAAFVTGLGAVSLLAQYGDTGLAVMH